MIPVETAIIESRPHPHPAHTVSDVVVGPTVASTSDTELVAAMLRALLDEDES